MILYHSHCDSLCLNKINKNQLKIHQKSTQNESTEEKTQKSSSKLKISISIEFQYKILNFLIENRLSIRLKSIESAAMKFHKKLETKSSKSLFSIKNENLIQKMSDPPPNRNWRSRFEMSLCRTRFAIKLKEFLRIFEMFVGLLLKRRNPMLSRRFRLNIYLFSFLNFCIVGMNVRCVWW